MSITRDKISGLNFVNDIPDGEYGAEELCRRIDSNFTAYNAANKSGWGQAFEDGDSVDYGNAKGREPRPSAVDGNAKSPRYTEGDHN